MLWIHEGHNYEQFQHCICVWQRYYALSKQDLSEHSTHPELEVFCFSCALQSADCPLFHEIPTWTKTSCSQEATPEPPLPPTPTRSHRGTLLLSHETRKAACSNPYLIQPFHIWIISQARDHFPGYKGSLPLSRLWDSPDQCCRGLGGCSTAAASFPLSQEITLPPHLFFLDRETASLRWDLKRWCPSRASVELSMFPGSAQIWADLTAPGSLPSSKDLSQPFFVVLGSPNAPLRVGHLSATWNTAKLNACYRSHSDQVCLHAGADRNIKRT